MNESTVAITATLWARQQSPGDEVWALPDGRITASTGEAISRTGYWQAHDGRAMLRFDPDQRCWHGYRWDPQLGLDDSWVEVDMDHEVWREDR